MSWATVVPRWAILRAESSALHTKAWATCQRGQRCISATKRQGRRTDGAYLHLWQPLASGHGYRHLHVCVETQWDSPTVRFTNAHGGRPCVHFFPAIAIMAWSLFARRPSHRRRHRKGYAAPWMRRPARNFFLLSTFWGSLLHYFANLFGCLDWKV